MNAVAEPSPAALDFDPREVIDHPSGFLALSPRNRRRYSWMPMRPNAQARGEVNSVKAGNASAKSCPAIIWKLRIGERPTPMPSAQSARPHAPVTPSPRWTTEIQPMAKPSSSAASSQPQKNCAT